MKLTTEDRAILAHRKVDVDTWVAHVLASPKHGEWAVRACIEKYRKPYLTELKNRGDGYKCRAERQAEIDAAIQADITAKVTAQRDAQVTHEKDVVTVLAAMPTKEAADALARLLST